MPNQEAKQIQPAPMASEQLSQEPSLEQVAGSLVQEQRAQRSQGQVLLRVPAWLMDAEPEQQKVWAQKLYQELYKPAENRQDQLDQNQQDPQDQNQQDQSDQ
jgi:hypothetical protein